MMTTSGRVGDEVGDLWARYKTSNEASARQALVETYYGLVCTVASHPAYDSFVATERGDIINYGVLGLVDAIERFEPERGIKFESYAVGRIHGAIRDKLREEDWIPKGVRAQIRTVEKVFSTLESALGRTPSNEEVAAEMGLAAERLHDIMVIDGQVRTAELDRPRTASLSRRSAAEMTTLAEMIPSGDCPEDELDVTEIRVRLSQCLGELEERHRVILALRLREEMTNEEIGDALGVSRTRASQLTTEAVLALRAALAGDHIDAFLGDT